MSDTPRTDALLKSDEDFWRSRFTQQPRVPYGLVEHARTLERENAALRTAAKGVCWFDWSHNDSDAVDAIQHLRAVLDGQTVPSDRGDLVREALEKFLPELEAMSLHPSNRTFFSATLAHFRRVLELQPHTNSGSEAVAIEAAWTLIQMGTARRDDGWHDFDAWDEGTMPDHETWIAFLESRGLMERHPTEACVKPLGALAEPCTARVGGPNDEPHGLTSAEIRSGEVPG